MRLRRSVWTDRHPIHEFDGKRNELPEAGSPGFKELCIANGLVFLQSRFACRFNKIETSTRFSCLSAEGFGRLAGTNFFSCRLALGKHFQASSHRQAQEDPATLHPDQWSIGYLVPGAG